MANRIVRRRNAFMQEVRRAVMQEDGSLRMVEENTTDHGFFTMSLWPDEIRFSHSSMGLVFRDGTPVAKTFRDIVFGHTNIHSIPLIEVYTVGGNYFAVSGNKRLRIYKELMKIGALAQPLQVLYMTRLPENFHQMFTTKTCGLTIEHDSSLNTRLQEIGTAWRQIDGTGYKGVNPDDIQPSPFPALQLRNIIQITGFVDALEDPEGFVKQYLRIHPHFFHEIERATRGQNNKYWYHYRYGRILTCHFGKILHLASAQCKPWQRQRLMEQLMRVLLGQERPRNQQIISYYKENSVHARKFYENAMSERLTSTSTAAVKPKPEAPSTTAPNKTGSNQKSAKAKPKPGSKKSAVEVTAPSAAPVSKSAPGNKSDSSKSSGGKLDGGSRNKSGGEKFGGSKSGGDKSGDGSSSSKSGGGNNRKSGNKSGGGDKSGSIDSGIDSAHKLTSGKACTKLVPIGPAIAPSHLTVLCPPQIEKLKHIGRGGGGGRLQSTSLSSEISSASSFQDEVSDGIVPDVSSSADEMSSPRQSPSYSVFESEITPTSSSDGSPVKILPRNEMPGNKSSTKGKSTAVMEKDPPSSAHKKRRLVTIQEHGIYISKNGMFGAVSDGIVRPSGKMVVIRCPYSLRSKRLAKMAGRNFFITKAPSGDGYILNRQNHVGLDYYHQIQGALYVGGYFECDLIVWSSHDQVIIPVRRDPDWMQYMPTLMRFYVEQFFPRFMRCVADVYERKNESYVTYGNAAAALRYSESDGYCTGYWSSA